MSSLPFHRRYKNGNNITVLLLPHSRETFLQRTKIALDKGKIIFVGLLLEGLCETVIAIHDFYDLILPINRE